MIVVGTDDQGVASSRLQIFEYIEETRFKLIVNFGTMIIMNFFFSIIRKWSNILSIAAMMFDPVHDVVFAPNLGR